MMIDRAASVFKNVEQAGFRSVVCIDNDSDSRETLRFNRPEWKMIESNNAIILIFL